MITRNTTNIANIKAAFEIDMSSYFGYSEKRKYVAWSIINYGLKGLTTSFSSMIPNINEDINKIIFSQYWEDNILHFNYLDSNNILQIDLRTGTINITTVIHYVK